MNLKVDKIRNIGISSISAYLLLMLVFYQSIMNKIIITVIPVENILGYVMLFCAVLVIITNKLHLNKKFCYFYLICIGVFVCSVAFVGFSAVWDYIFQFISFGSCGIVCAFVSFDYKILYKCGGVVTIIYIALTLLQNFADAQYSAFAFGYALMPGVLSVFWLVYNSYIEKKLGAFLFWMIIEIVSLYCLLHYCSRGNLLQIYIFGTLCLFIVFKKKLLGAMSVLAAVIGVVFIEPIIMILYRIMESLGLFISVIWKCYWLLTTPGQTLVHGREDLFASVFSDLQPIHLLVGHGIGAYEAIHESYVHNMYLQAFYECGIIGFVFAIAMTILLLKQMFAKGNTLYEKELYILLFVLVIVKLCLSDVYWRVSLFWFLIVFIINKSEQQREKNMMVLKV